MMEKELSLRQVLKHRDSIYGFCALWILFFHVYVWTEQRLFYPLTNFITCGNCGVDIFLFLSGLCLCLSFKKRIDYGEYYKKRATRILMPYIVISLPYWIWKSIIEYPEKTVLRAILNIIADFSSATFWLKGTQTTWFVFAICVFYLLFPWLYKNIRKSKLTAILLFVIACAFGLVSSYIPVVNYSSIVWARLPVFISGIIVGSYYDQKSVRNQKYVVTVIGSLALTIMLCLLFSLRTILGVYPVALWYSYGIIGIAVIVCLTVIFCTTSKVKPAVFFSFIGTLSLELYLVHVPVLHLLRYNGILEKAGIWNYVILPLIAIPLAYFGRQICLFLRETFKKI